MDCEILIFSAEHVDIIKLAIWIHFKFDIHTQIFMRMRREANSILIYSERAYNNIIRTVIKTSLFEASSYGRLQYYSTQKNAYQCEKFTIHNTDFYVKAQKVVAI